MKMSDYRYRFVVSIGFSSAEREAEWDLVDDLGYSEESLADPGTLENVLEEVLRDEIGEVNDSYYKKIED